jgi:ABC-type transporter Mla MlaB component
VTTTCHPVSSPPGSGPHPASPGLVPGIDPDAGLGVSPLSVSRSRLGLAIHGEIDESSFCFFAEALSALASGLSLVQIDLTGVEYCDVAGLRLMVRLTGAEGREGDHTGARRVVLHGAAPYLRAVLGVLGWDCTPGLILG